MSKDVKLSKAATDVVVITSCLFVVVVTYKVCEYFIPGFNGGVIILEEWPLLIFALALGLLAHELLHLFGFMAFGRCTRDEIKLGFSPKHMMVTMTCEVPLQKWAMFWVGALPGLVLGIVPLVIGLIAQLSFLAFWAFGMTAIASVDFVQILLIAVKAPAGSIIRDNPDGLGFTIESLPVRDG